ncbi:MAG: SDR family NAD(P)-dependent oxidoreductase, partial [FCB group bacterium]|nr:SDR family NAD(P)-dependent oxidoreductase [FCB group bacterium]
MDRSRIIFITGATSGIGAACTTFFSNNGWKVYGGSRRITKETITPEGAVLFPLDVTKPDSVSAIVKTILDREKRLDVVLNNAGFGIGGPLETTSLEEAKSQFETNFFGVHLVNQAVLPYFRKQGSGRIVIVGSIGGRIGLPFQGMYSATKFA